jgi:hypothetical protein
VAISYTISKDVAEPDGQRRYRQPGQGLSTPRDYAAHVAAMSDEQLQAERRGLKASIAFMEDGNGMLGPSRAYLAALDNELARRLIDDAG